ncbi:hypothetical protein RHGRI_033110 [Rhododendron griersonianum]|uniref:Uncharacterized protein n=1 Tax=Rhododendron griersonianum TaxID=479676 RepID=A0AAV6I120_9ERIC|nr:hypothetical protein RHGRI_033110 [Rhododendron griersonianum]
MSNIMGLSRPYVYGNFVPLHFTKNGEVLIAVNRNKLFVYNPNKMPQREILISSGRYEIHVASYAESLASPAAYGHKEDWVEEGKDALELAYDRWGWSSCFDSYGGDWEWLYIGADDEDNNWVRNVFWKKEENQEKFKRSSGLCYDSSADDYKAVIAYRGKGKHYNALPSIRANVCCNLYDFPVQRQLGSAKYRDVPVTKCLEEICRSSDIQSHAYTLAAKALRAQDEHHRLAGLGVSHPTPTQDVTCQEEVHYSYEEPEAATPAQPAGKHDVNVVEDVDEIQAVEGQVEEGLAEKSQVKEESHVDRIIDMEDGGQLGGSGAYTLYRGGNQ